jgi:hypothetical protein
MGIDEFLYTDSFDYFEYSLSLLYLKQLEGNCSLWDALVGEPKVGTEEKLLLPGKKKSQQRKKNSLN